MKKIILKMNGRACRSLSDVKKRTNESSDQKVFQKALALYDMITEHQAEGGIAILQDHIKIDSTLPRLFEN